MNNPIDEKHVEFYAILISSSYNFRWVIDMTYKQTTVDDLITIKSYAFL